MGLDNLDFFCKGLGKRFFDFNGLVTAVRALNR